MWQSVGLRAQKINNTPGHELFQTFCVIVLEISQGLFRVAIAKFRSAIPLIDIWRIEKLAICMAERIERSLLVLDLASLVHDRILL